eukprot:TRINITY_DN928_c0_g1_i6.p1 TRINITY_DN928_c0_g1~~TRINITY_DN928_c0_g1_i6.p1  ORF type:complete len:474 (+),score=118.23 TRINITY_DN928_c0_g1_i6:245-1666(+)
MDAKFVDSAAEYADQHKLYDLFQGILKDLVVAQPSDPVDFIIKKLQQPNVLKIVIVGAPASGKGTMAESIVKTYNVVHISTGDLLRKAIKDGTDLGRQAKDYMDRGKLVPDHLVIGLVKERTSLSDCQERGWMLDGFPRTRTQAISMLTSGILPNKVIVLEVPDQILMERATGRRIDPETGYSYHIKFRPPPADIAQRVIQRPDDTVETMNSRLHEYRKYLPGLIESFAHILQRFDGSKESSVIFPDVQMYLTLQPPSGAMRRPHKIFLIGGPGSGRKKVATLLAAKFGLIHIRVSELVSICAAGQSKLSQDANMYLRQGRAVPDDILVQLIKTKVATHECYAKGWIIDDFPNNDAQATLLRAANVDATSVFHLDVDKATASSRIVDRRVDPQTGWTYNIKKDLPKSEEIKARLVVRPEDSEQSFAKAFSDWESHSQGLLKHYANSAIKVSATGTTQSIFETIQGLVEYRTAH